MTLEDLFQEIENFRVARDWKKFHKPKDLVISLCLEASEVLEHFQWKTNSEIEEYLSAHKERLGEELADVLIYLLLLSHEAGVDLLDASFKKVKKNEEKYPVEKAKGVG